MHTYELEKFVNPVEDINIIYVKRDWGCKVHIHEFVELIFIVSGSAVHYVDDVEYEARAGDILFVNYGQTHAFKAQGEEYCYYNLIYVPKFFSEELINSENIYEIFSLSLFREFMGIKLKRSQAVHFKGNEYLEIKKLVEEMYREFSGKEMGYRSVLNGYSRVLFSRILRKLKGEETDASSTNCIGQIIEECLSYIDEKCYKKLSLKEIAERTFYNPAYLSRIFKEHCGISLSEYIKEKRIQEAARLLADSELSNEEIMYQVGYADKKQFYKNFKDIYQVTPSEYRKNNFGRKQG